MSEVVPETWCCCCGCSYQSGCMLIAFFGIISSWALMLLVILTLDNSSSCLEVFIFCYLLINLVMNLALLNGAANRKKKEVEVSFAYRCGNVLTCLIGTLLTFTRIWLSPQVSTHYPYTLRFVALVHIVVGAYETYVVKCFLTELEEEAATNAQDETIRSLRHIEKVV